MGTDNAGELGDFAQFIFSVANVEMGMLNAHFEVGEEVGEDFLSNWMVDGSRKENEWLEEAGCGWALRDAGRKKRLSLLPMFEHYAQLEEQKKAADSVAS